ncbi:MAG: VCBS repeat-containing protein [Deltaproteobacteria bacterium]|nr:VCBS repeat-containing protein [Deltaproteobacteria bacterium]
MRATAAITALAAFVALFPRPLFAAPPSATFGPRRTYPISSSAIAVGVAGGDISGDGIADLVSASINSEAQNTLNLFLGRGDGSFAVQTPVAPPDLQITLSGGVLAMNALAVAALAPDDALADVIIAGEGLAGFSGMPVLRVYEGRELKLHGAFPANSVCNELADPPQPCSFDSLVIADFSGDGLLDLVAGDSGTGFLAFYRRQSGSLLKQSPLLGTGSTPTTPAGALPTALAAGDFDGDGARDLAVALQGENAIALHRNNGSASGMPFEPALLLATAADPFTLVAADLDRDGRLDLAALNADGRVAIHRNTGISPGGFAFAAPMFYPFVTAPPLFTPGVGPAMAAGDFNRDEITDLAVLDAPDDTNGAIAVRLGNGDATFASASIASALDQMPSALSASDLNGDGYTDLAAVDLGDETGTSLSVVLSNGVAPPFTPTATPTATPTFTRTRTPTITPTSTRTATATRTPTRTATLTATATPTRTPTATRTSTATRTPTNTRTPTRTGTPTKTGTPTRTGTPTATATPSPTPRLPRGDADCDATVTSADLAALFERLFDPAPPCDGADANDDGRINAADVPDLLRRLFHL